LLISVALGFTSKLPYAIILCDFPQKARDVPQKCCSRDDIDPLAKDADGFAQKSENPSHGSVRMASSPFYQQGLKN